MARKTDTQSPVALRLDVAAKRRLEELRQRYGMTAKELGGRIIEGFCQLPPDIQVVMLGQLSKKAEIAVLESVLETKRGKAILAEPTPEIPAAGEQAEVEESTARILVRMMQQLRDQSVPLPPPARSPKRRPG